MRGVLVTLVATAAVLGTTASGFGTGPESGLGLRKATVRLHKYRGMERDRMRLRGAIPALQGDFDPRRDPVNLLVAGKEVLCEPGGFPLGPEEPPGPDPGPSPSPSPSPNPTYPDPLDPPDYGRRVPGNPGTAARDWTLQQGRDGTWIFRTEGRRLDLNLERGTIAVSGRNLDLDALTDAGNEGVDIAVEMGGETFGTVVDFDRRGRAWRYAEGR